MTCKDCMHYEVCIRRKTSISLDPMKSGYKCPEFKNKADFSEVKRGEWVLFSRDIAGRAFICSLCGNVEVTEDFETSPLENDCNYCSKCGAKMEGNT